MSDTNLATVEPIDKAPKKPRKPRKSPARGAAKAVQPSPVEAFQVLASRGHMGVVDPQKDYRDVINIISEMDFDGFPAALKAGIEKGFPGLVVAYQSGDDVLENIVNGVA